MTERLIQLRQNGRRVIRGVSHNAGADRYELNQNEGETLNTVLDLSALLTGGETVTAATHDTKGMTVSLTLASPKVTVQTSALDSQSHADSTITITRSGGQVHKIRLRALPTARFDTAALSYSRFA